MPFDGNNFILLINLSQTFSWSQLILFVRAVETDNMSPDYSDLRNKTFLDFTGDQAIVNRILVGEDVDTFRSTVSELGRCLTFAELAEITGDQDLTKAVEEQFGYLFNE